MRCGDCASGPSVHCTPAGIGTLPRHNHEFINQNLLYAGSLPSFVRALPGGHEEVQTINRKSVLGVQYGVTDALALTVDLPFIHRTHIDDGRTGSFDFSGFGDMTLGAQYSIFSPPEDFKPALSLQVSAKLPTGVTSAAGTDGEAAEVTIQPGSGSFDAIAGLHYPQDLFLAPTLTGEFGLVPLTAELSYQANGKGTGGYPTGNTLLVHAGTEYPLWRRVSVLLQVNGMFQEFADTGSTGEPAENTGGRWIYVSPGARLRLIDAVPSLDMFSFPSTATSTAYSSPRHSTCKSD